MKNFDVIVENLCQPGEQIIRGYAHDKNVITLSDKSGEWKITYSKKPPTDFDELLYYETALREANNKIKHIKDLGKKEDWNKYVGKYFKRYIEHDGKKFLSHIMFLENIEFRDEVILHDVIVELYTEYWSCPSYRGKYFSLPRQSADKYFTEKYVEISKKEYMKILEDNIEEFKQNLLSKIK